MKNNFLNNYVKNLKYSLDKIDFKQLNHTIKILSELRKRRGRLYIIGIGGSAGNASHTASDFRKLCNIDAYSPVDNITEITAKTNDDGFDTIFQTYLELSALTRNDVVMVFSVGGGNLKKKVSVNLIKAIKFARRKNAKIISIIGRKDGFAYKNSDTKIFVDVKYKEFITPISETFQTLVWHLLVTHPNLKKNKTKW